MSTSNPCGECDLCCRLLAIEELKKPAGAPCAHFEAGCSIYADRPHACRSFHCRWLKSERLPQESRLGPEWRPDRARFVMYAERGDMRLNVVVEPAHPTAWKREPYYSFLKLMSERVAEGFELLVHVGDRLTVVFPNEDVDLGQVEPGQQLVVGHAERGGRQVPYARLVGDGPAGSDAQREGRAIKMSGRRPVRAPARVQN